MPIVYSRSGMTIASSESGSLKDLVEGNRANLRDANLSGADLSGARGLLDASEWLSTNFQRDNKGALVYKRVSQKQTAEYALPEHWTISAGSRLTEVPCPDRGTECGSGVHFGTLSWVRSHYPRVELWMCRIEWMDLAGVVVPFMTDGKARCAALTLLGIVDDPDSHTPDDALRIAAEFDASQAEKASVSWTNFS